MSQYVPTPSHPAAVRVHRHDYDNDELVKGHKIVRDHNWNFELNMPYFTSKLGSSRHSSVSVCIKSPLTVQNLILDAKCST